MSEDKKTEPIEQETHCYECLKTRAFTTIMIVITIGTTIALYLAVGEKPPNIEMVIIFVLFWAGVVLFAGIIFPSILAYKCIRAYCDKSDDYNYKQAGAIVCFGILMLFTISIIIAASVTFIDNYNFVIPVDANGCYIVPDKYSENGWSRECK